MSGTDKKLQPKEYDYDSIMITLQNCILPAEKLDETPSMKDGLDRDTENELRMYGCELIQIAGLLLKLPQVAMATGQVILQRFYYSKSLIKHDIEISTMAAVYLAAKIEEAPRRIRDVINVCHHIKQRKTQKPYVPMDFLSSQYFNMKTAVIKTERRILIELGFCVHIKHPHKIIITYLQILEAEKNVALARRAWNYMNDSLRTDIFVKYVPEKIACACIFLAARTEKVILPSRPPWWQLFEADIEEIKDISLSIMTLYSVPRRKISALQAVVTKLKKTLQEKKENQENATNNGSFTPSHTPNTNITTTANNNNPKPTSKTNTPEKEKKLSSVITSKVERHSDSHDRQRHRDKRRRRSESVDSSESESDSDSELPSRKYARQRKQYESKKRSSRSPSSSDSEHRRPATKTRRSASPVERKHDKYISKDRNGHKNNIKSKKRSRSRSPVKRASSPSSRKYYKEKNRSNERYRDKYSSKPRR